MTDHETSTLHPVPDPPSPAASSSDVLSDDVLDTMLGALPRERARDGFTAAVLARSGVAAPQRARWPMALAAAALLLLVVGLGWREMELARQQRATEARITALRAEYDALARELAATRRLAESARPVVYLRGDEAMEFHLDLAALARRQRALDLRAAQAVGSDASRAVPALDQRSY
ncbi:MAG: hypothetical protein AAGC60_29090 [Acidobacteriota bacterium]